jgi:ferredoxin
MKVVVDHDLCEGHGRCYAVAPELYEVDDDGYSAITEASVEPGLEDAAREGAVACPRRAISVIE